ncbi:MAG: DUF4349 domain-containing protein, partial [Chloroflexota bacterium]
MNCNPMGKRSRGKRPFRLLLLLSVGLFFLAACASDEPQVIEVDRVVVETETITETITEIVEAEEVIVEITRIVEVASSAPPAADRPSDAPAPPRLIIKDGTLVVETADPEQAVTAATQHVIDVGGYIINQSVTTGEDGHRRATMRLAVPV